MKRKIYQELLQWKEKYAGHTALLIYGARRVGKNCIAELFARQEYKSYILLDFNNASRQIQELFSLSVNTLCFCV